MSKQREVTSRLREFAVQEKMVSVGNWLWTLRPFSPKLPSPESTHNSPVYTETPILEKGGRFLYFMSPVVRI